MSGIGLVIQLAYLLSAVLFILGLKRLSSPATARRGNALAASGMLLAVVATLLDEKIVTFEWIVAGLVVGGLIGLLMARLVKMTAMPQMVAVFNGLGGLASGLVAAAEFLSGSAAGGAVSLDAAISIVVGTLIGAVTFSGSLVAFGKLQELKFVKDVSFSGQQLINLGLDSPVRFHDELVADEIANLEAMPSLSTEWYEAYKTWCQKSGVRAAPQKTFTNQLKRKRGVPNEKKHYRSPSGKRLGPHWFLLVGQAEPPDGKTQMDHLGHCAERSREMIEAYRGVNK